MSVEYERPKDTTDYRFSPSEIKLLTLLPQDGTKINTLELTKKFYSDRKTLPEYARIAIGGLIRALVDKTYDFKRGFRVMRSERQGPKPILIWMEVLPSRAKAKPAQAKPTKPTSKPDEVPLSSLLPQDKAMGSPGPGPGVPERQELLRLVNGHEDRENESRPG
jgi:hypothetical protein